LLPSPARRCAVSFSSKSSSFVMSSKDFVQQLIKENDVIVFSKTYCPYCTKAKKALDSVGASYKVIELDERADGGSILSALAELTGRRTVPNVFVHQRSIGGGDDTDALARAGKLKPLIENKAQL